MPCDIGELPKKENPMLVEAPITKIDIDEEDLDEVDEVSTRKTLQNHISLNSKILNIKRTLDRKQCLI